MIPNEIELELGPELVCPRCGNKDWLAVRGGVLCSVCMHGILIKVIYDLRKDAIT